MNDTLNLTWSSKRQTLDINFMISCNMVVPKPEDIQQTATVMSVPSKQLLAQHQDDNLNSQPSLSGSEEERDNSSSSGASQSSASSHRGAYSAELADVLAAAADVLGDDDEAGGVDLPSADVDDEDYLYSDQVKIWSHVCDVKNSFFGEKMWCLPKDFV